MHVSVDEGRRIVQRAQYPVVLTGAGISESCGLPLMDERVEGQPVQRLFDRSFFRDEPRRYYRVFANIVNAWRIVRPNVAHYALADANIPVITLNIDGLHRDAGTRHLIELHGNIRELRCRKCSGIFSSELVLRNSPPTCPTCQTFLEPGFCLEGDEVHHFSLALDWTGRADLLLIIGTSLHDAPANRLPQIAYRRKIPVLSIDQNAEHLVPALLSHRVPSSVE